MSYRNSPRFTRIFAWLVFFVFAALIGLEVYGFTTADLFSQPIWFPVGLNRFIRYTGFFAAWSFPLLLFTPWATAGFIAALAAVFTVIAIGPLSLLATIFFLVSACTLGHNLFGRKTLRTKENSLENDVCATLAGTAVYIFLMTCLARMPVNYPAVWAAILAIPVAMDCRGSARRIASWCRRIGGLELRARKERAAFALLAFVLLMHWLVVLKPEGGADALAMHLAIPADIAANHRLAYEPAQLVWAVMPMAGDLGYAIAYLLGGEAASRLMNFSMLLMAAALLYCAIRRSAGRPATFVLVALFASTPLVQLVTGSLFVENVLAAFILGSLTAVWRFGDTGQRQFLYLAALLGGTAAAIKLGALAFLIASLPFAVWEARCHWRQLGRRPVLLCALAVGIFLLAAAPPYVIAYYKTANPLFPFLNLKFPSPVLDRAATISDLRYHQPLAWTTLYGLTFQTHRFFEGLNGSFGFQYLVVVPLALLSLLAAPNRRAIAACVVALAAGLLILMSEPNVRYLYAALPLIFIPFAALLQWTAKNRRWLFRLLIGFAVVCTAVDAGFAPASGWEHKEFYSPVVFTPHGREKFIHDSTPLRDVIMYFNRLHPHDSVLLESDGDIADAPDKVHQYSWHEYGLLTKIRNAVGVHGMLQVVQRENLRYFIGHKQAVVDPYEPGAMRDFFASCTNPEYADGPFYLARLDPACTGLDAAGVEAHMEARPPGVLQPGTHDDFEPALLFRGSWIRDPAFAEPYLHTISYSDEPGSKVIFAFEGRALSYVFTKAPNRGIASLTIDGSAYGPVDLYSPRVEWRSSMQIPGLAPGRHVVVIGVSGQKNPKATGQFVDIDCVVIR